jgi:hypothetical protein
MCRCVLRDDHREGAFGNRVLRRIFRPNRREVAGGCKTLHNDEFHNLYASPNIIRVIKSRRMRWARHVARLEEVRNTYKILVWKSEGKRPLGRPRRCLEDNISMDLREICWEGVDWMHLAHDKDQGFYKRQGISWLAE